MKKRTLSQSEYGMWMNEQAFPGEAVNTIGFRLYLPEHEAGEVCEAADWVIKETALFHLQLVTEDNEVYLTENPQKDSHCILGKTVTLEEANDLWDSEQKRSLAPAETKVLLRPVQEGGSFLIALFHHLVIDGHSLCQVGQMILDRVSGVRTSPDAIRYDEFIGIDPGDELSDTERKEHKDFWISYFAGVNAEPSLYTGSPEGCALEGYDYELSKVESLRIADYAKLIGTTESAVLGAALSVYLARAARTKDAVFLMPRLNRDTPELRAAAGCRTLVVPVRNEIRQDMTFSDLCRQSMEKARSAAQHKRYGMGNILNDLHEAGIIAGALSEYVLNYHAGHPESKIPFDFMIGNGGAMHNHLTISVSRFGDTLQFHYDARVGIYTEESIRFFHEALLSILTQAMQGNPLIKDMEIVGDEEKKLLLCLRGKQVPVSETDSIPDLFRAAVEKNPDAPALYAGDIAYTFRELDAVSNRIANALIKKGIRQGEPVMYKLRRTHRLIAAMLGISKAGAAFIPVDPDYPADRINYIQEDSGAAFMITQDEFLKESARPGLVLLDVDELLSEQDESDPKLTIPQEQLAYSIYTSGTTGKPKGVMLTHKGIVNITNPDNNPFNRDIITCGRGIVAIGSVCFDISLFEFFVPLFNGMFIEFAPENALADSRAIADLIRRHGANMLHLTPSRLSVYLQERNFSTAIAGVEVVLAAGEVLPGSLVDRLKNDYGIRIYNGYGPTETTIGATITKAGDNISIGKPIANTGILILDDEGRLLPFGMAGEICIYGNGVGLGYRNRPEETKKRFSEALGFRIYKTGDLGRFLPDGRILYLGRNDFQVKLRGLRIELSEIENCMLTYPQVASAVVQVRKIAGSEHLVGFYTVNEGEKADSADLKEHLKRHLTLYMVPDILKEIDRLPQTPGGKTDLKAVEAIPVEYVRNYRAPETELQKAVCEAFGAVLRDEKIGLDDNFFELGGDSLHTAELVMEIEKRLPDVNVKYEDIFRNPVPELLAQHLYRDGSGNEEEDMLKDLDYSGIRELLSGNTIEEKDGIGQEKLGNILLTGAAGFLGIHILLELLKHPDYYDRIYCLVRPTKRQTGERRLRARLMFFDEAEAVEEIGKTVFALQGDISADEIFEQKPDMKIDTVINCAANVSHFAYDDKLERTNTGGVKNLLRFCAESGAKLIQVSTISVGGIYRKGEEPLTLTEKDLYIGQEIRNQYILSKYMAEYAALRAAVDQGIEVKIMRVGNLQGRISDGEFQVQKKTNAFTRQLLGYAQVGYVPQSLYDSSVNFSPVDEVARMIVALSRMPKKYCVFHVYPPQDTPFNRLFSTLSELGFRLEIVDDNSFAERLKALRQDEEGRRIAESILVERPSLQYLDTAVSEDFTQRLLSKLGCYWQPVTDGYLNKYLKALVEMQLTEED